MRIAVVIPCYKVSDHICDVIRGIGGGVHSIFVVDDCCPEKSGALVKRLCDDPRLQVIHHTTNQGVGGAVISGYRAALESGAEIIVKLDGDGQMEPALIHVFVAALIAGEADYTKGNRFFDLEKVRSMPKGRIFGNAVLSFMTKLSSGYWDLFDPTNGYTAIHANVLRHLPLEKISRRYFFETDMLFRLNTIRARVVDVPMYARYVGAASSLKASRIIGEFVYKHIRNFIKRIFYNYYLRDMSLASIQLPLGLILLFWGAGYGGYHWIESARAGVSTPAGKVMLSALPILMGTQFLLAFLAHDISTIPGRAIHKSLR